MTTPRIYLSNETTNNSVRSIEHLVHDRSSQVDDVRDQAKIFAQYLYDNTSCIYLDTIRDHLEILAFESHAETQNPDDRLVDIRGVWSKDT